MKQAKGMTSYPEPGSHIFVLRSVSYAHHGIFMGEDKVVHFQTPLETGLMDSSEVVQTSFQEFLGTDREWHEYEYDVSDEQFGTSPRGTCSTRKSGDMEVVFKRAREALREGFGKFNIVGCNCEDFALFCKTGERTHTSGQYLSAMSRIQAARQAAATGYKNPFVYAGCVLGWFTAKDFGNQEEVSRNHINSSAKERCEEC